MRNVVLIFSIIYVFVFTGCTTQKNNIYENDNIEVSMQEKALDKGSKILKENFSEIINDKSKFIVYDYAGAWHIQNIFSDMECEYNDGIRFFEKIENIRYVKLSYDCDEIIAIGDYKEVNSDFAIYYLDSAKEIAGNIFRQLYKNTDICLIAGDEVYNHNKEITCFNVSCWFEEMDGNCADICIRKDGLITYFSYHKR